MQSLDTDQNNGSAEDAFILPAAHYRVGKDHASAHQSVADDTIAEIHNLEKIRNILFGKQIRDQEQRFVQIDEHLRQECASLNAALKAEILRIENYLHNEFKSLRTELALEKSETSEKIACLDHQYKDLNQKLIQEVSNIEGKITDSTQELNQKILVETNRMSKQICQKSDEVMAIVERELKSLQASSRADKSRLARFFGELAKDLES
jgi:hypothetical protein